MRNRDLERDSIVGPRRCKSPGASGFLGLVGLACLLTPALLAAPLSANQEQPPTGPAQAATSRGTGFDLTNLIDVPAPNVESMEAAVREQLTAAHRELTIARQQYLDASPTGREGLSAEERRELAQIHGQVGRLYFLYDLIDAATAAFDNAVRLDDDNPRWHYYLGTSYFTNGRWDDAAEQFDRTLALKPGDPPALLRRGRLELERFSTGAPEAAELAESARSFFEPLVEQPAYAAAAHFGLGKVAAQVGDSATAAEHFEAALTLQPEATAIHYPLALAYRDLGRIDQARAQLALRGERDTAFPDPAIEELGRLVAGASAFVIRGNRLSRAGRLDEAIEAFETAVDLDPDGRVGRQGLGATLAAVGRLGEAAVQYQAAVDLDPDDSFAHYNLGTLQAQMGRDDEAVRSLLRAIELAPDLKSAHFNLGSAYARQGRFEQARHHFQRTVEIDPQDTEAQIQLAGTLGRLGQGAEAELRLKRILAEQPDLDSAHLRLGALLLDRGAVEEALSHYRAAVATESPLPRAFGGLGVALARLGRFEEAAEAYSRQIEAAPRQADGHFGQALALLLAERDLEARKALESSIEALPEDLDLVHLLARVLATAEPAAARDGERAVDLAGTVFSARQTPEHAETLAMALAESGRFDEAVNWQRQVVQRLVAAGATGPAQAARQRLALYENETPCRRPWK